MAIVVVIVVLAAGCGSGESSSTTTTAASTQDWANGLCGAANTYVSSLTSLGTNLKAGDLTKSGLEGLVDGAKKANQTFADSVKSLGSPPVSDSQAKQLLEALQSELSKNADAVKSATGSVSSPAEIATAITTVTATLTSAGLQTTNAYDQLKALDPKGEIQKAFTSAPACAMVVGS